MNGNKASEDDFNGHRVCYANDLSRKLENVRVEGLANTQSCSAVTAAGASLPAGSRKVSTTWHPDWRLQTQVAEPGRITTYVYNGKGDPFNGNSIISCAPAGAQLPDGQPIAVLCKQVEQATTDSNGSLGFQAVLQSSTVNRVQSWTYNQDGQVLTHDGPRTDVNDVTTYTYYTSASANYRPGDLWMVTNGIGQVTSYLAYTGDGYLRQSLDANGNYSSFTYDLRRRLTASALLDGQTTTYTYDPAGQLTQATLPDGSYIGYEYDDAHRLRVVSDNRGNRIDYTPDNLGIRRLEEVRDPGGTLRRQLTRVPDALGRIQQTTGRE